jgi:SHS2 domain-containing protein
LNEAIEQVLVSMYAYLTLDINSVERVYSMEFKASGSDMNSLLYNLMDECLYNFNAEPLFIGRCVKVISFDEKNFSIKVRAWGESFDLKKHHPGTEIKAITYSNMQINRHSDTGRYDIYVVVDI